MKKVASEKERSSIIKHASGSVLEIGFGSGLNLPYYKNVTKLYALEPSLELFTYAQDRIHNAAFPVDYIQASAEKIPLPDSSIDTIVSTWTLCTIPHPELALKEIARVLKPGGTFAFIEHGKSPQRIISQFQKILTPFSKCLAGGCHLNREIENLISEAGFEFITLEKFDQYSRLLSFTYKGVAMVSK